VEEFNRNYGSGGDNTRSPLDFLESVRVRVDIDLVFDELGTQDMVVNSIPKCIKSFIRIFYSQFLYSRIIKTCIVNRSVQMSPVAGRLVRWKDEELSNP
jgi:hypothetical protein